LLAEVADPLAAALRDEAERLTGLGPSLDFGLVAIRRALRLPRGAAFALFAVGRAVGWIAHALEQRKQGILIRPRAVYVGNAPGEGALTSAAPA
jgi:citrate synthase